MYVNTIYIDTDFHNEYIMKYIISTKTSLVLFKEYINGKSIFCGIESLKNILFSKPLLVHLVKYWETYFPFQYFQRLKHLWRNHFSFQLCPHVQ